MSFYAGPQQGALALVESPAQLLNVIELGRHEDDLSGVKVAVLAPVSGLTRTQEKSLWMARTPGTATGMQVNNRNWQLEGGDSRRRTVPAI